MCKIIRSICEHNKKNKKNSVTGKEEKINGTWYYVTVKANSYREAVKKICVGQRKSYGTVEAVRGRFVEIP